MLEPLPLVPSPSVLKCLVGCALHACSFLAGGGKGGMRGYTFSFWYMLTTF